MQLVEIQDKKQLNEFFGAQPHAEFLQSWEWGEFQKKVEGGIMRFGIEDDGKIIAAATLVKKSLPMGMNYFYCPRGPVIREQRTENREQILNFFFEEIKKIGQKEKSIFLRFEPNNQFQIPNSKFQIYKSIDIQPAQTIDLDLSKSEEELLSAMHQKTRYNIRLAEKKGVKIMEADKNTLPFQGGAGGGFAAANVK